MIGMGYEVFHGSDGYGARGCLEIHSKRDSCGFLRHMECDI